MLGLLPDRPSVSSQIPRTALVLVVGLGLGFGMNGNAFAQQQGAQQGQLQGGADTTEVTFREAVQFALQQNTDLGRAQTTVQGSDSQLWSEWMDFAPSVDLNSSVRRNFGQSFDQVSGNLISQKTDFLNMGGGLSFTIFDGFEQVSSLQQAQDQNRADDFNLQRTQREVVFTVIEQYINLVEAREEVRVRREEVNALRQQLEQIEALVDAGSRAISDLYTQQADVADAEQQLLVARRDLEVAQTDLIQTLQLDPRAAYDFKDPALPDTIEAVDYDPQALITEGFDNRMDLRRVRAEKQAAEEEIQQAKSDFYPSLTFSANYSTDWSSRSLAPIPGTGSDPIQARVPTVNGENVPETIPVTVPGSGQQPEFRQQGFGKQFLDNLQGSLSLSLSIPVFSQWNRKAQVEQAQVQARNAEFELQDQRQTIASEVRQAYLDYRNAEQQLEAANARLRAARQAREAAQERYNLGSADIVELQNANRDFVDAASQQVRARYNLLFREKQIDFFTGRLSPTDPLFTQ